MKIYLIVLFLDVVISSRALPQFPFDDDDAYEYKIYENQIQNLSQSIRFIAWVILSGVVMYPIISIFKAILWKSMIASVKASTAQISNPAVVLNAIV